MAFIENINDYPFVGRPEDPPAAIGIIGFEIPSDANVFEEIDVDNVNRNIMYYAQDVGNVIQQPGGELIFIIIRLNSVLSPGTPNEYTFLAKVLNRAEHPGNQEHWTYHPIAAAGWPPYYEDINHEFRSGNNITP